MRPFPVLRSAALTFLAVFALAAPAAAQVASWWTLADGLEAHPAYRGMPPRKSDVIFSTRTDREGALQVAKSFQANRIEWVYTSNQVFLKEAVTDFEWFGGAVNSTLGFHKVEGRSLDFDGNAVVPPWMKFWDARLITTISEEARNVLATHVNRYVRAGARSIQFDDPLLQWGSAQWGGDFSPSSLAGFRQYLAQDVSKVDLARLGIGDPQAFDYREYLKTRYGIHDNAEYLQKMARLPTTGMWRRYLRKTVLDYFAALRSELQRHQNPLALSINLSILDRPNDKNPHFDFIRFVDYAMTETPLNKGLPDQFMRGATHRAFGIGYAPSPRPGQRDQNRLFISLSYALGANPIVPWDVYMHMGDGTTPSRLYGKPEEYADLYRFARAHAGWLDDHEATPVVGIVVPVSNYRDKETMEVLSRLVERNVPFALFLTGRPDMQLTLDAKRLQAVRHWVAVNPMDDFDAADRTVLTVVADRQIALNALSDATLQGLAIAEVTGSRAQPVLVPRARRMPNGQLSLALHIDEDEREPHHTCNRAIRINGALLHGWKLTTAESAGSDGASGTAMVSGSEIRIGCAPWTVLHLTYAPDAR